QSLTNLGFGDIVEQGDLPTAPRQHQTQPARDRFLIVAHDGDQILNGPTLWTDRQTKPPQHTHLPLGQFSWDEAAAFREPTGANHPGRNRLAVQPCTISGHGLESMRKSVPIVEDGPQTSFFPLILLNDLRLKLTAPGDDMTNGFRLPAQDR